MDASDSDVDVDGAQAPEEEPPVPLEAVIAPAGPPPDGDEKPPEYHLVESCRSVKGDTVWVQWLGYPKGRNCWRSVSSHFPLLEGGSDVLATHSRLKMSVRPETAEESAAADEAGLVLQGRKPPGGDIRTAPAPLRAPSERPAGSSAPPPKKTKKDFESRVHTIRIDDDGSCTETRGMRRAGVLQVTSSTVRMGEACGAESGESSQHAGSSSSDARTDVGANGADGADGGNGGATGGDERSELWAAHRLINEAALKKPKGCMFRVEVSDTTNSQVTVKWLFPESSPGNASAWIGLWDANGAHACMHSASLCQPPRSTSRLACTAARTLTRVVCVCVCVRVCVCMCICVRACAARRL